MKIAGRKVFGFITLIIVFTGIFFTILFKNPELLPSIASPLIYALISVFIIFVGGNISAKFIKSKWFQPGLCEKSGSENEGE